MIEVFTAGAAATTIGGWENARLQALCEVLVGLQRQLVVVRKDLDNKVFWIPISQSQKMTNSERIRLGSSFDARSKVVKVEWSVIESSSPVHRRPQSWFCEWLSRKDVCGNRQI